tara:strand:+ start:773 stop:1315 length:543 start_codon:yes stop_codon:yes gene_type:complete
MILGLCGLARSGKDSFFEFAKDYYHEKKIECKRFAFADELKKEIDDSLKSELNISSFTDDPKEKEIIRPRLVYYGMKKREETKGYYWIGKLKNKVINYSEQGNVAIITDTRFENEIDWVNNANGISIYISRQGNKAPNSEEKENDPIVKSKSSNIFDWMNFPEFPSIDAKNTVFNFLDLI